MTRHIPTPSEGALVFEIPLPPTSNNIFRNATEKERAAARRNKKKIPGRRQTKEYVTWQVHAGLLLNGQFAKQGQRKIAGPVEIGILCCRADKRAGDVDNRIKAPIDLLVRHKVIDDDRNVVRVTAEWVDDASIEGAVVVVRPWAGEKARAAA